MNTLSLYRTAAAWITAGACLFITTTSCKKLLNKEPKSAFDEEYVFNSVANATSAVMGAYEAVTGLQGYGSRLSLMYPYDTDEMIGVTNTSAPDNSSRDLSRYNYRSTNAQLPGPFQLLYVGIERANTCIKNIPGMQQYTGGSALEQQQLKRLQGEALTLRALYYLELIRNWGDVPAQFEPSIDQVDLFLPKADRDSIYDRLLADLKTAADLVPWRNEAGVNIDERITKAAVKGLRARIALFRGGYSLRRGSNQMERRSDFPTYYKIARDECFDIMQRRDIHTLNPSFQSVFKDGLDSYKIDPFGEVIFELAMAKGLTGNLGYYDGPRFYVEGNSGQLGNSSIRIVPTYFYSFDSLDQRRDVTTAPYYNNADKTKTLQTLVNMTSGKFRADWINPAPTSTTQQLGINWPLLRFSDVLLMFAEAENELNNGPTPAATAAYEEVRKRGFGANAGNIGATPTDKAAFFTAIVNERFWEFGGEGIRKYDLIRWNLLAQKIEETRANYTKLLNRQAPYDKVPQHMFYKTGSATIVYGNSLYKASPSAISGFTRINWVASITSAWVTNVAQLFTPNKGELMPIPQSAIESNYRLSQDYGY
ncbi:RagB/SusD family nutrient uptake outer membrane protein [Paraflavitalea pollutisoli]|uniref:RagB/SusD family nutrient uptake outer membrane protein n=1 Tax=Paraflavitalea pollutisoli TaxID=3034143 RepID=UPI0023EC1B02|nr:RagB/SusD family nutrient uptake outer membrane protein [Paraflavitalea sp. H1-2-19X]